MLLIILIVLLLMSGGGFLNSGYAGWGGGYGAPSVSAVIVFLIVLVLFKVI